MKGKSVSEWDYFMAVAVALESSYIPVTTVDFYDPSAHRQDFENPEQYYILPERRENQEHLVIKRDLFNKLSDEAKTIVRIIFAAPDEVLEQFMCCANNPRVSRPLLRRYLKAAYDWRYKEIDNAIEELRNLAGSL